LFIALDTFTVSFLLGGPAKLLSALDDPLAAKHWALQIIMPGKQFVGALAVEQGWTGRINQWQWSSQPWQSSRNGGKAERFT